MAITLYGHPPSRSTRVAWALEEAKLDWTHRTVKLETGEGRSPEFLRLNPAGKVPVLQDGALVLTESAAICTYVGDKVPDLGLTPQGDITRRAAYNQWCNFAISELEQPLWTMGKHRFALPADKRVSAIMPVAAWEFSRVAAILAQALEGRETVLAEGFSMADVLIAHTLHWARAFQVPLGYPVLEDYADRHLSRPALARAMQKEREG